MTHLISIDNCTFKYPDQSRLSRDTLHEINIQIDEGEYIAILGANGSGKTTLARMMNALLLPDTGTVQIDGLDTKTLSNLSHIRKTVGMVFQFPEEQIFSSTIEEDVAFGLENFGWEYTEMHRQVQEVLQELGLWEIRQRPSYLLSAGQTQRLALAGVLAIRPRCIIFDEATSMLDPLGRQTVLQQMQELHADGNTIIHITHSMDEASLATRVIVLYEGEVVYDGDSADLFSGKFELKHWRLELPLEMQLIQEVKNSGLDLPEQIRDIDSLAGWFGSHKSVFKFNQDVSDHPPGNPLEVEVHQLGHIYLEGTPYQTRAIRNTDLDVEKGGCHGLIGVTGSGKSTLLQHLNGLIRPQIGTVRVGPFDTGDKNIALQQIVEYAGLVMQNPEVQFFQEYVGDEIAYGPRMMKIDEPIAKRVEWAMDQVGLDFEAFKDRRLYSLSGGEKRKVALASILALKPKVLLLDEPTAGLDPSTHQEILQVFEKMVSEGTTMVVSSHNMEDIAILTDRVTVLVDGQSISQGFTEYILGDTQKMEELRMISPVTSRLVTAIKQYGVSLPANIATFEQFSRLLKVGQSE